MRQTPASPAILVLGGYGLIGSAIVRRLLAAGHRVVGAGRRIAKARQRMPKAEWRHADLARLRADDECEELLADIGVVVNAAGLLQDGPNDDVKALQVDAMQRLFTICAKKGITIINISATGVESSSVPFMSTKHETDEWLRKLDVDWAILRPGLVLSPVAFGGSGLLRAIAGMPLVLLSALGDRQVRAVHVDDVALAVLACVERRVPLRRPYDLVSDDAPTFEALLLAMRTWLGHSPEPVLRVPARAIRPLFWLGDLAGHLGWRSPMRSATFEQLSQGIEGNPEPWRSTSGRGLGTVADILDRIPVGVQEHWFARLWVLKPMILIVLSAFWVVSGAIGAIQADAAAEVLTHRGANADFARLAVFGGAALDILIGLGVAWRRTARMALIGSLLLSLGYLAGATAFASDLWSDPLGPLVKIVPAMMLSLVAMAVLEDR